MLSYRHVIIQTISWPDYADSPHTLKHPHPIQYRTRHVKKVLRKYADSVAHPFVNIVGHPRLLTPLRFIYLPQDFPLQFVVLIEQNRIHVNQTK